MNEHIHTPHTPDLSVSDVGQATDLSPFTTEFIVVSVVLGTCLILSYCAGMALVGAMVSLRRTRKKRKQKGFG